MTTEEIVELDTFDVDTFDVDTFDELPSIEEAELVTLRRRLALAADSAGVLDVAYRTIDTPVGPVMLAASVVGLIRVAFDCEGFDAVLGMLATKVSPRILHAPGRLDDAARELDEYFAGRRHRFDLALDMTLSNGFRRLVVEYLPQITYGRTAAYAAVATAIGNAKAVRAVGSACATNPLPLVIPCHRVIRSDGVIGAYRGGTEAKRLLLGLEAAH